MPEATDTVTTNRPDLPDLDAELSVMRGSHEMIAQLNYEARVRVLAWLARRFDVDDDALRF